MKLGEAIEWCVKNAGKEMVHDSGVIIRYSEVGAGIERRSAEETFWTKLYNGNGFLKGSFKIVKQTDLEMAIKAFGCQADNVRKFVKALKKELKK